MINLKGSAFVAALLIASSSVLAADVITTKSVLETRTSNDDYFGGCAVRLSAWVGSGCSNWVSFDCKGDKGTSKDSAYRMYDSALMAYALGRQVKVTMDNAVKYGAVCVAKRIDVKPAP